MHAAVGCRAWVRESVQPRFAIGATTNYGSLWRNERIRVQGEARSRPHGVRQRRQLLVFIPELDLVVATTGGNYADRSTFALLTEIIPKFILPAVVE
jgi:hypothetical protein